MNLEKIPNKETKGDLSPFEEGALSEKINEGSHATIHRLRREGKPDLIAKVGQTAEYSPPFLKALKLSFPRKAVSKLFERYLGPEFKIYPDMDFIKNGLAEYVLMKKYFGKEAVRGDGGESQEPNTREELIKALEDAASPFYKEMAAAGIGPKKLEMLVDIIKRHSQDNFLPKEHLVVGHPPGLKQEDAERAIASGEKPASTYYIIQEPIEGEGVMPLYQLDDRELAQRPELVEKLLTFAVLAKKMYSDTGKLIDTRPEEVGKHPFEWFRQTANLLVDKKNDRLSFVDTRWLWDKNSKLGRGGVNLVERLGMKSVDRAIRSYYGLLHPESEDIKHPTHQF